MKKKPINKLCRKCGKHFPNKSEYFKSLRDTKTSICRGCQPIIDLDRADERTTSREHYLLNKYKITLEDYDRMEAEQAGLCAICLKPPKKTDKLFVDHCHTTNDVRGLLCASCNTGLGYFYDNPKSLIRPLSIFGEKCPSLRWRT